MKSFIMAFTMLFLALSLIPKASLAQVPPGPPQCDGRWINPEWHDGNHDWREAQFVVHQQQERDLFERMEQERSARHAGICTAATQNTQSAQAQLTQATFIANSNNCGHNDACHAQEWAMVQTSLTRLQAAQADQQAKCAQ